MALEGILAGLVLILQPHELERLFDIVNHFTGTSIVAARIITTFGRWVGALKFYFVRQYVSN